jgi:hypothetical protein
MNEDRVHILERKIERIAEMIELLLERCEKSDRRIINKPAPASPINGGER